MTWPTFLERYFRKDELHLEDEFTAEALLYICCTGVSAHTALGVGEEEG